jgi:hypothetical protein
MKRQRHFLSSAVLLRVAGLSIDLLEGQRATVVSYRLSQYELRKVAWQKRQEALLAALLAVVETMDLGQSQQRLQQLRRDLHNGRVIQTHQFETVRPLMNNTLADRLWAHIREGNALDRYLRTTGSIYRKQALLARRAFQSAIGDASFGQGLALSSLSLLRHRKVYQQRDPAQFRKDDYQLENGLVRYFTRAATKTTPYSMLAHVTLATQPSESSGNYAQTHSHVQLSMRVLGLLHELMRTNRPLREHEPVQLNPSLTIADGYLHYIRQHDGQVACARLPISPALRWVISTRMPVSTYTNWIDSIRTRFRATSVQAHQYIDKLLKLGLLHQDMPVSATDQTWPNALRSWLVRHRWLTPAFADDLIRLLDALVSTARTLPEATAHQRALLLQKAHLLLTERVSRLPRAPSTDFWPLRAEQLFFEDVIHLVCPALQTTDTASLIQLTRQLTGHIATTCLPPENSLLELFGTACPAEKTTVSLVSFFEQYLRHQHSVRRTLTVPESQREQWESWARRGMRGSTVHLRSEWMPNTPSKALSEAIVWQTWTDKRGKTCAAINSEAGAFGRMYGRFLPYFDLSHTRSIRQLNREAAGNVWLVEPTDNHYHNPNMHPPLLDGVVLTPGGHHTPAEHPIQLNDLVVRLLPDESTLALWHIPTNRRVVVADIGFQAERSKLYTFLCQFAPGKQASVGLFCSVINCWYTNQDSSPSSTIWPRIMLDNQLMIQRQTWCLLVGPGTELPPHDDAFIFFRLAHDWQRAHKLPDEVFVNLPHATSPDDRKPQYIRFDNPLLVDLLRQLLRKAANARNRIRVVEMRPNSGELARINGHPFAIEAVPQWYNITQNTTPVCEPENLCDQTQAHLLSEV